jgi:hypothetical protein
MRRADWQERLAAEIAAAQSTGFEWGRNDCGHFVARCVRAVTGRDCFPDIKAYSNAKGLARALKAAKFASLGDGVSQFFAEHEFALLAKRGDVALVMGDDGEALGVVSTDGTQIICLGVNGIERLPITRAVRAWGIA